MPEKQSSINSLFNNINKDRIKSFIGKNRIDLMFISSIAIFTLVIVYLLININNQLGIYCSDVFIYLLNSVNFAGYSLGTRSTMYLSPVVCFLTSLIFRLGFIDQNAIFIVTGLFFPIASIGVYLLCRLHLNKLISLFGTFLFISFSLNILWVANGSLDIPAVAISIWIMYFLVLAIDKNPKYFVVAFPLFIIGFFTRYTVGFILPLMILYILFKIDFFDKIKLVFDKKLFIKNIKDLIKSKSFKCFMLGIIIATGILIVILNGLLALDSNLTFITQTQDVISGGKGSSTDPGFKSDHLFYLTNLPNFISSNKISFNGPVPILQDPSILSYFVIGLIIFGFLFYVFKTIIEYIKNTVRIDKKEKKNFSTEIAKSKKYLQKLDKLNSMQITGIKIIGVAILSIVLIATYNEISSVISEALFLINILLVFNILNKYSIKNLNFKLLMFSWFMMYLIFFSFTNIKVDRYFITVMPVIAYFATYSLNFLINEMNRIDFVKNKLFLNLNSFKRNKQIDEYNRTKEKVIANDKIKRNIRTSEKVIDNERIKEKYIEMNKKSQISFLGTLIPIVLVIMFMMSSFANVGSIPIKNTIIQDPIQASKWLMSYDPDYDSKVIWTHNRRYYTWYLKTNVLGAYEKDLPKLEENNVSYLIFDKYYLIENYTLIKRYDNVYIYKKNM